MLDIASYVTMQGGANDGLHNQVSGYFWWAWNANSGTSQAMIVVGQVTELQDAAHRRTCGGYGCFVQAMSMGS